MQYKTQCFKSKQTFYNNYLKNKIDNYNLFSHTLTKKKQAQLKEGKIYYQIKLFWAEELQQRCRIQGYIFVSQQKSLDNVQNLIINDLKTKGYRIKKGSKLMIKFKKTTEIFKLDLYSDLQDIQLPTIQGILIEYKINLPQGYNYLPNKFKGFILQNLSISNTHGTISWNTPLDITNIDFSQGLTINANSIQCLIDSLNTDVLVQFFQLPVGTKQYLQTYGVDKFKDQIQCYLSQFLYSQWKLVGFFTNNQHWFVYLVLNTKFK